MEFTFPRLVESMPLFVDPRTSPVPGAGPPAKHLTPDPALLEELLLLCKQGRLYDIEGWIAGDRPLQLVASARQSRRRNTALSIALKQQNHALVLLLLCNGYDPNQEPVCALDLALDARRPDLAHLLLDWGADPHAVELEKLFDSYDSSLFERFYSLGVDLTKRHALAEALAYHTSNKPLFGFVKRHGTSDERLRRELNMALAHHAGEGNEKGVLLCLWAGADPHAPALSVRYGYMDDDEEDEEPAGGSAISTASFGGHVELLRRFQPDPARDDFDALLAWTRSPGVVDLLASLALPTDVTAVVKQKIWASSWFREDQDPVGALRRLFELGMRWTDATVEEIGEIRRMLLQAPEYVFEAIVWVLGTSDYCASSIRRELARTTGFQKRLQARGLMPERGDRGWFRRHGAPQAKLLLAAFGLDVQPAAKKRQRR